MIDLDEPRLPVGESIYLGETIGPLEFTLPKRPFDFRKTGDGLVWTIKRLDGVNDFTFGFQVLDRKSIARIVSFEARVVLGAVAVPPSALSWVLDSEKKEARRRDETIPVVVARMGDRIVCAFRGAGLPPVGMTIQVGRDGNWKGIRFHSGDNPELSIVIRPDWF